MSLPTEQRPIRMDPDLAKRVDSLLEPYDGEDLDHAQEAVMRVYQSPASGSFGQLVARYEAAIQEAVSA